MRLGFISLLLVLGSTGLAGCGGGGGSLTPTDSQATEGTYDPVPSIDALPASINPTTYTPTPGAYDTPPGQANVGGIGAGATIDSVCAELCTDVLGLSCPVTTGSFASDQGNGQNTDPNTDPNADPNAPATSSPTVASPAECTDACVQAEAQEPCPNELAAALACILEHVQLSCDLLKDASSQSSLDEQLAASCQTALLEYVGCRDGQPQAAEPPPQDNCTGNSCGQCSDACARCKCRNNGDAAACTTMCP